MSRWATQIGWEDAPHLSDQAKQALLESIPPSQRAARTRGVPQLGAGAIYPIHEDDILCDAFEIPFYWRHVFGMDIGWNRTAAVWAAHDVEADVLYLTSEYYASQAEPVIHATAIKAHGAWIPGVIDPAARGRKQDDGDRMLDIYTRPPCDLRLITADNSVEAGLLRLWQRMSTGRLKVFRHLRNWLQEFRIYRRDEKGKVVKENDHLMDATRYLEMTGVALAAQQPRDRWGQLLGKRTTSALADYDPFAEPGRMDNGHDRPYAGGYDPYRGG